MIMILEAMKALPELVAEVWDTYKPSPEESEKCKRV
jgi:hypothetical protein